jgi:hypothetical protein
MAQKIELVENWWDEGKNPITGIHIWRGHRRTHTPKNKTTSSWSKKYEHQEKNL